jgi:hypothetical protein
LDEVIYHVLLEGRKVGPYDRRTIVGMRIKKTLTSDHVLIATDGTQLTVGDLIGHPPVKSFQPERSGSFSLVQATYTAALLDIRGDAFDIPRFKGEVETRVQGDVLRMAGRFRKGLGWKEDRVKLMLKDVVHARVRTSQVDLWLRNPDAPNAPLQRVTLELFSHESAGELVDWLPAATALPESAPGALTPAARSDRKMLWVLAAGVTTAVVLGVVLMSVLLRTRVH